MNPRFHSISIAALLFLAIFALSFTAGFVYGHEPRHDSIEITFVDKSRPVAERFVNGTVTSVDDSKIVVLTNDRELTVRISETLSVEQLSSTGMWRTASSTLVPGTPVNLGGRISNGTPVLTGIVTFEQKRSTQ